MDPKLCLDNTFVDLFTRRKLTVLVLSWIACIALLLSYRVIFPDESLVTCPNPIELPLIDKNETGPFAAWRQDALIESQAECRVEFDNLRAENGRIGLFRTASSKTASIDNLRVTFRQANDREYGECVRLGDFCDLFAPRREELTKASRIGVLTRFGDSESDCTIPIDLTNTTLVQIRNMAWEIRCDGQSVMTVECRRASLQGESPYVLLQGHAVIRTPTGLLEGNCIKMNVRDNCFVVDGHYLLTRNGHRRSGVGGCFDTELRPYQVASLAEREPDAWTHTNQLGLL